MSEQIAQNLPGSHLYCGGGLGKDAYDQTLAMTFIRARQCARSKFKCTSVLLLSSIFLASLTPSFFWRVSPRVFPFSIAILDIFATNHYLQYWEFPKTSKLNGGLAHYVIAAATVASHNVKHAWVLAWVASRFAASSCALRFSHFAIVLQFSWTKFFTKS